MEAVEIQRQQFRRISRFRPSHVSAMGFEPPRDQTPVNLSSVTATDIWKRRDQSERMLTDIIGERVVIRFAPEVGINFTHDVHGLAGPAVHEIIGGEPCLAMVISQVYLDALIRISAFRFPLCRDFIPGDLFAHELVIRFVVVERPDDVVAITPRVGTSDRLVRKPQQAQGMPFS